MTSAIGDRRWAKLSDDRTIGSSEHRAIGALRDRTIGLSGHRVIGRLGALVVLLFVGLVAGSCAPKTAPVTTPNAPRYPEFVYPAPPAALASSRAANTQQLGWDWLQSGDLRTAERTFAAALKQAPGFYPAEAGLGYVALARKDHKAAVSHFERAVSANASYAPALAGRGEALLALGERDRAIESFSAALAADPGLTSLRGRVEVLRLRGLQDDVTVARTAAEAGKLADARTAYQQAIAASPESAFLYRELAAVEQREGNLPAALEHAQRSAQLDPNEPRTPALIGSIYEAQGDLQKAADAYRDAVALEPNEALDAKIDELREKAAFAAMPDEYKSIETAPAITRAQLAALIGVQLADLVKRAPRQNAVVMTDTRGNWAAPWIFSVTRAGIMVGYPNHTFQPNGTVRRGDLAQIAGRALNIIAATDTVSAAKWQNARRKFPDVSMSHLAYPAASMAVEAGVMETASDGSFQLARPVSGADAVETVRKLKELSERARR